MRYFHMVPALVLVLVFAFAASTSAGILRGEDFGDPGSIGGGGEEDGDHPWGGDQVSGSGGTVTTQTYRLTAYSGYPALDILISEFLSYITGAVSTTQQKSSVQSAVQNADATVVKQTPAVTISSRFRPHKGVK